MHHWFRRSHLDPQGESNVILWVFVAVLIICVVVAVGIALFAPAEQAAVAKNARDIALTIVVMLAVLAALLAGVRKMLDL